MYQIVGRVSMRLEYPMPVPHARDRSLLNSSEVERRAGHLEEDRRSRGGADRKLAPVGTLIGLTGLRTLFTAEGGPRAGHTLQLGQCLLERDLIQSRQQSSRGAAALK